VICGLQTLRMVVKLAGINFVICSLETIREVVNFGEVNFAICGSQTICVVINLENTLSFPVEHIQIDTFSVRVIIANFIEMKISPSEHFLLYSNVFGIVSL